MKRAASLLLIVMMSPAQTVFGCGSPPDPWGNASAYAAWCSCMGGTYNASTTACEGATGPSRNTDPSQPDINRQKQRQQEINRQAEEAWQQRKAEERKQQEARRKAFEKSRQEALDLLKGGDTLTSGEHQESVKLKSGTPTFGIKGNPSGELRLKDPPAVTMEGSTVTPAFFTRPQPQLRIRSVPNPMQAPAGSWRSYVKSNRAELILDALEQGKGNLDQSIAYLDRQLNLHGSHQAASNALSFLEGMRTSYVAVDKEYRKTAGSKGAITISSQILLKAVSEPAGIQKWPGEENPNPENKLPNPIDWRNKRTDLMLDALERSPGDLEQTYSYLRNHSDIFTAAEAEHYLRGVFAYWDYLARTGDNP